MHSDTSAASFRKIRRLSAGFLLLIGGAGLVAGTHSLGDRRAVELLIGCAGVLSAVGYLASDLLLTFAVKTARTRGLLRD